MGVFDQMFDNLSWSQVCYRLPSKMAVEALQRRVTNLDTLKMFFENVSVKTARVDSLKNHINSIMSDCTLDEIFDTFDESFHPVIFNWANDDNIRRIKSYDPSKLSKKFLFNLADSSDADMLKEILEQTLNEPELNQNHIRAVFSKADSTCAMPMLNMLINDPRPEVRACILSIPGLTNRNLVTDTQKIIGLKAFAECESYKPIPAVSVINMNLFNSLRPEEKLDALERYLAYFPRYRKVPAFSPAPTEDEFQAIIFAGCIEQNERIQKLNELYKQITELDEPDNEEDE